MFEDWLYKIIMEKGINLSVIARKTGVSYRAIYNSLRGTGRELRAGELIAICRYVGVNPMDYKQGVMPTLEEE